MHDKQSDQKTCELREMNTVEMIARCWQVSTKTVRKEIARGKLSCFRIGDCIRITKAMAEEYQARCTFPARADKAEAPVTTPNPAEQHRFRECVNRLRAEVNPNEALRRRIMGIPER